jgi:hypothetical protein
MHTLHVSRHALNIIEGVAAGGLAAAVTLLSVITAATLIYAWFIA